MHGAGVGGFVVGRSDVLQGLGGVVLFARADEGEVAQFERVKARLDAAIVGMFARAAAHASFG